MFASLQIFFFIIEHVHFASLDSQGNVNLLCFALIFKCINKKNFASLRNKVSNYERLRGLNCIWSVCTTEACAAPGSVCTKEECTAPGRVYTTEACAASGRVCTTEECTAPGHVYTSEAWAASGRVCSTEECAATGGVNTTWVWAASGRVSTTEASAVPGSVCHRGLSWIWTFLHYRGMCCSWRCLHTGAWAASRHV